MGVRGLDESGTVQEAGNVKPNMRLVYVMEDLYIPRTEILTLEAEVMAEAEKAAQRKGQEAFDRLTLNPCLQAGVFSHKK